LPLCAIFAFSTPQPLIQQARSKAWQSFGRRFTGHVEIGSNGRSALGVETGWNR
jgi:hypothetical protein